MRLIQKLGLSVAGAALVALLVAHNPTKGYVTRDVVAVTRIANAPSLALFQRGHMAPKAEVDKAIAQARVVSSRRFDIRLGLLDWRSKGAFFAPLKTVGSALLTAGVIVAAGLAWILCFRRTGKG